VLTLSVIETDLAFVTSRMTASIRLGKMSNNDTVLLLQLHNQIQALMWLTNIFSN
jgi:hypothetical protein